MYAPRRRVSEEALSRVILSLLCNLCAQSPFGDHSASLLQAATYNFPSFLFSTYVSVRLTFLKAPRNLAFHVLHFIPTPSCPHLSHSALALCNRTYFVALYTIEHPIFLFSSRLSTPIICNIYLSLILVIVNKFTRCTTYNIQNWVSSPR